VQRSGLPLDNGQHLLLGAYSATRRLAATLHSGDEASPFASAALAIQPFAHDQRNAYSLRARGLPAPFGLLAGLLRAGGLDWRERIAAVRWFARLRRRRFNCAPGATVAALLDGLPRRIRDDVWAPICLAALNTPPQRASAQVFANVLRAAFDADADAALGRISGQTGGEDARIVVDQ
jgi:predicted NAD/FAD-binding protein